MLVLRSQAESIVEEAWPQLTDSLNAPRAIGVSVEGANAKRIVENAVLEFMDRSGIRGHVGHQSDQGEVLVVTVLEQIAGFTPLENGSSRRELRTAIEFRRTSVGSGRVLTAGPLRRSVIDTVRVRDDETLAELRINEEQSFVEKVLGPVVLIGGVFLVIYLFFTVRN